ncbi:hypothetical protein PPTG_17078 [Phytophthora nicotianae INRA-310]|uniref:Uncharacterized protein n=1 Tax=Phytophthora nicotianae (strain INRA-310) TaxID=761204 RepID=W2PMZ1_PHYN3|nr:hypothetical protein PPTG_17078 [Phytophthora nicotianae INRA-310]ETN01624.1 hypothetical protein PPTG_17078 [Phytophthora nicotianae INRA-310]
MISGEIISDAKLLEEVSTFLNETDLVLARTSRDGGASGTSLCESWFPMNGNSDDERTTSSSNTTVNTAKSNRKMGQKKEALRRQRYQRRLRQERETLRRMEKSLTARLVQVKEAYEARDCSVEARDGQINWLLRDVAKQKRAERFRAEEEQKQLVEIITSQATYLSTLRDMITDQYATTFGL